MKLHTQLIRFFPYTIVYENKKNVLGNFLTPENVLTFENCKKPFTTVTHIHSFLKESQNLRTRYEHAEAGDSWRIFVLHTVFSGGSLVIRL